MAIQSNQRVKADIAKEKRKLNAIQRKMELQEKKEEFGEAWKRSLKEEQKKAESVEQKVELSSPVFMGMAVSAGILISAMLILKNISKDKV